MMDNQKKQFVVVLSLLCYSTLMEGAGVCKFARMYPTQRENRYTSCELKTEESITVNGKSVSTLEESISEPQVTSSTNNAEQHTSPPPTTPPCALNMVVGPSCECEKTCQNPYMCNCTGPETCVCPDGLLINNSVCIPENECACFDAADDVLIPKGEFFIKHDCSRKCNCTDDELICDPNYSCSFDATCHVIKGVGQCCCNDGYVGDGQVCELYKDCNDAYQSGHREDGIFTILPNGWPQSPFNVSCDMTTSGGGWTMLQRNGNPNSNFKYAFTTFKTGAGSLFESFWLGNEQIYYLTNQRDYVLRVDVLSSDNVTMYYQEYSSFKIADESEKYRLIELGSNSGTAGDVMAGTNGSQFSTLETDNDGCTPLPCAQEHGWVGWWFSRDWCETCCDEEDPTCFFDPISGCNKRCTKANLNGPLMVPNTYNTLFCTSGCGNISSAEMKIRPSN